MRLLMVLKSGYRNQLRLVGNLSRYLRRVLYVPGGAGFLPSTVCQVVKECNLQLFCLLIGGDGGGGNMETHIYI